MSRPSPCLTLILLAALTCAAFAQEPEAGRAALEQGRAALTAGDLPQAEEQFQAALAAGQTEAWDGLAEVRLREGDREGAAAALWELHGVRPADRVVERRLAGLLAGMPGHEWEALPLHLRLHEEQPDDLPLRLDLARLQSTLGWHEEARAHYQAILAAAPGTDFERAAELGLADDLVRAGEVHQAREIFRRYLVESPDPRALRGLADLEFAQGRPDVAARLYAQVLELDPDDFVARERSRGASIAAGPRVLARVQGYSASDDWSRVKLLGGVEFPLAPDFRLTVALEEARFEEAGGASLDRSSLLVRGDWRPDAFVHLFTDLESGDQGGGSNPRGGVAILYEPVESASFRAGYRHDDFLDPVDPFAFDRFPDATDLRLLSIAGLQSDTFHAAAAYEPPGGIGFAGSVEGGTIEDGNNRSDSRLQLQLPRELGPGWRWMPFAAYRHRHYQLASPYYFTPSNLESWGGGARLAATTWDGDRAGFVQFEAFRQPSGIDAWGFSAEAGLEQRIGASGSLELQLAWLTTPERGPGARLRSFAAMLGFGLAF